MKVNFRGNSYKAHDSVFDTQSEARAAALAWAELLDQAETNFVSIEVLPEMRRDTGESATVVISRPEKDGTVEFELAVQTIKPNAKTEGWLVFFDVHI